MQYLGIDWSYRRAAWCALGEGGAIIDEGAVPADEDGLARLVLKLGVDVNACVEMMSGAISVHDRLREAGWQVQIAHARKVRDIAPLACKTEGRRACAGRAVSAAIWSPSCGSHRYKTVSCASACADGCTWSGCAPRR
jgi:hypothetical protein